MNTKWIEQSIFISAPILIFLAIPSMMHPPACDFSDCSDPSYKLSYDIGTYLAPLIIFGGYLSIGLFLRHRRIKGKDVPRSSINH